MVPFGAEGTLCPPGAMLASIREMDIWVCEAIHDSRSSLCGPAVGSNGNCSLKASKPGKLISPAVYATKHGKTRTRGKNMVTTASKSLVWRLVSRRRGIVSNFQTSGATSPRSLRYATLKAFSFRGCGYQLRCKDSRKIK